MQVRHLRKGHAFVIRQHGAAGHHLMVPARQQRQHSFGIGFIPGLAQHLGIPHVSDVCEILEAAEDHLIVRRVWEDAEQEVYLPLPALITVVKGQNLPKLPTIGGMLRGRTADISLFTAQSLNADVTRCGLKGSPTQVVRTFTPPVRGQAQEIQGTEAQQASSLARIIREVTNGTD